LLNKKSLVIINTMEAPENFFEFLYKPYAICECKTAIENANTKQTVEQNCKCKRNPSKKT